MQDQKSSIEPHPHWTLGSVAVAGLLLGVAALVVGIVAMSITASRNSVDDVLVADAVEIALAANGGSVPGDVIPALVPKGELPLASQIATSTAPDVPPPVDRTDQAIVEVHFEVVEGVAAIDPETGVDYETWGYKVIDAPDEGVVVGTPGPMIRARVGDIFRFTITNPEGNTHPHNVDFHAVTGQGGGAEHTTVAPGETTTIEARLLYPGFFMYHCAYGDVPLHISHGMFGGILVEPEIPLPRAEREWYVVQSEYYTDSAEAGLVETDRSSITNEAPTFVVFNGAKGAIAGDNSLQMNVGEKARFYFINAGLNLISSFHPIGSHWDAVYPEAALMNSPLRGSQTTLVPAGGGTVVEMIGQVPSTIILVDHALARAFDKGALGMVVISGEENVEIFEPLGAGGAEEPEGTTTTAPGGEEAASVSIVPGAFEFQEADSPDEFADSESPADYSINTLTVKVGTTVTWTNDDNMLHTVTALDGSFDSGFFDNGESFSYTFTEVGEFEYFCLPHPWMRAKVIVEG
jgi:nitrite reductase (NO-forming)